jgi:hypothetical protein
MSVSLVAEPGPDPGLRARHDILVGSAVGVQLAQHRRHFGRFGVDRRVAEERAKVRGQDRRQAAGHSLQNVAGKSLDQGGVVVIGEKVQLGQEFPRIHAPERNHLP